MVLDRIFFSLNEDCAWHRCLESVTHVDRHSGHDGIGAAVEGWIKNWAPRVSRAVSAFRPIFDDMPPSGVVRFATVFNEIEQFGQRYRGALFESAA